MFLFGVKQPQGVLLGDVPSGQLFPALMFYWHTTVYHRPLSHWPNVVLCTTHCLTTHCPTFHPTVQFLLTHVFCFTSSLSHCPTVLQPLCLTISALPAHHLTELVTVPLSHCPLSKCPTVSLTNFLSSHWPTVSLPFSLLSHCPTAHCHTDQLFPLPSVWLMAN